MLLDDIASYLQTGGYGTVGTNLFKGEVPAGAPDTCVCVWEYPGLGDILTSAGVAAEQPRVQVGVRYSTGYEDARKRAESIRQYLDLADTTINSCRYLWIHPLRPPVHLPPKDAHDLPWVVVNFEVLKELSPTT